MITLFISKGELIYSLILFGLLAMYGLGNFVLSKLNHQLQKVKSMTTEELETRFRELVCDYEKKPSLFKGQELTGILEEKKNRGLFKNLTDTELTDRYNDLSKVYTTTPTFWKKRELSYFRKEMKKRHLL